MDEVSKLQCFENAVKIAIAAAGSGGNSCVSDNALANIIKTTYDQMLKIREGINL